MPRQLKGPSLFDCTHHLYQLWGDESMAMVNRPTERYSKLTELGLGYRLRQVKWRQ